MDSVIQIEILLNYLNDLFAKSVAFNDIKAMEELNVLRHQIYYGTFDYHSMIQKLQDLDQVLKKYV